MMSAREVSYNVDGMTMVAYLARPQGKGPGPAVLLDTMGWVWTNINVVAPTTWPRAAM